ncbi:MAG: type III pantothenate kinase, partial [Candidatus Sumerlaeaceae bacterium]|nr:type III pantothenate kinase [Candidatus Sumerlaeaceae bacterium]
MIVAVDIGNTNVVVGVFDGDRVVARWRLASDTRRTADEYGVFLKALLSRCSSVESCPEGIVVGSVVPVLSDVLDAALRQLFACELFHVTHASPMPVTNSYAKPNEVGVDRLANAVGGTMLYGRPLIVVCLLYT